VWFFFEARQGMRRRSEATSGDRGSAIAIRVSVLVAALEAVRAKRWLPSATIGTETTAASIGLVVLWCGVGLRVWSFRTLGRYFTFTVQTSRDQPVIAEGPYRVIRHPGYAGLLIAVVGIGFAIDNWASLVALTSAITIGLIYRIRVEERALSRDLGGRYQRYAASRKRLVPFVW
jgi:protein-S-isoprenylcysteine O-methyltransferase Ste14